MEFEIERVLNQRFVSAAIQSLLASLEKDFPADLEGAQRHSRRREKLRELLPEVVRNRIMPELSLPPVSTIVDLVEGGAIHLAYEHQVGFDAAYERFVMHAAADTALCLESASINLMPTFDDPCDVGPPETLWESDNGFHLRCDLEHDPAYPIGSPCYLRVAILQGTCTQRAMDDAAREVKRVTNTTGASFADIWPAMEYDAVAPSPPLDLPVDESFPSPARIETRDYSERAFIDLLRRMIYAYFLSPSKKDSLNNRLRNAVRLLVESDRQKDYGLRLATSFSALEALVCNKTDGISEMLSLNVATILKCDSNDRLAFKKQIKKLYDLRSRVLHGDYAPITWDDQSQARELAARVMYALFEWQAYSKRFGESDEGSENFFAQLDDARTAGLRMPGVPDFV